MICHLDQRLTSFNVFQGMLASVASALYKFSSMMRRASGRDKIGSEDTRILAC
jgi:hypothetical protein